MPKDELQRIIFRECVSLRNQEIQQQQQYQQQQQHHMR